MDLHRARGAGVGLLLALSFIQPSFGAPAVAPTGVVVDPIGDASPDSCAASPEEAMLDNAVLKDLASKNGNARREAGSCRPCACGVRAERASGV